MAEPVSPLRRPRKEPIIFGLNVICPTCKARKQDCPVCHGRGYIRHASDK